ncbi:saccharopine dehydrogenase NADP-binding domain-containing protein [Hydrogenophaga sp. 5NK40-0174]|uniref:saccharopine dehydrogenase family protein n=1 Tax=Hydrogenophaga sp. 5NK40-0174 TaxID=3127649 RepID=UPI003109A1C8
MNKHHRILVLGGHGNFGARICKRLASDPGIELMVAARRHDKARAFAQTLRGAAQAVMLDAQRPDLAQTLRKLQVHTLIHTAGPFQAQEYLVARACAEAGAHYIDLADGREFVCAFPNALNSAFTAAGKLAVSGASTVPALSSAVVDHLTIGWQAIDSIDVCIAPAQSAPRGQATIAAVLSYCGRPIPVWQDGKWQSTIGWASPTPVQFAHMKPRLGAVCDIPDLQLFPEHYSVRNSVRFRAALEVGLSQRAFAWLAYCVQRGWIRHPERLASVMHRFAPMFDRWGSALGGMVVSVDGLDEQGKAIHREWHISADNDHGPEIPTMAAILLARQLASGHPGGKVGAHTATSLLPLDAFQSEFKHWGMVTEIRQHAQD